MLRVTQDVLEIRRWAEARDARPCRNPASGRLGFAFPGEDCPFPIGWDEFEPAFCAAGCVFVCEDRPDGRRCFVGGTEEARAYVAAERGVGASAP
jgi:hypothetical protein